MLPERHRDISWPSALTLTVAFLPLAVLVGYIPGLWWWIAAGLMMVAFFSAMWFVADREERMRAVIGAMTSRYVGAAGVALAAAIVTGLALGVPGDIPARERRSNAPTPVLVCRDGKFVATTLPKYAVARLVDARRVFVGGWRSSRVREVGPLKC